MFYSDRSCSRCSLNISFSFTSSGLALIAVMWLVAALSVLVTGIIATARADLRTTQNFRLFAEHAAAGDAAIRLAAVTMLMAPTASGPVKFQFAFEGRTLNVEVYPASGFVDLNHASTDLLRETLAYGAELPENDARILADRIADWRDPDRSSLPEGAERPEYEAAQSRFRPRDGPFESVDDLVQVLGVSLDLHDKLRGLLTTRGESPGVDPRYAPAPVLAVLAAGNIRAVDRILAARARNDPLIDMTGLKQEYLADASTLHYRFEAWRQEGDLRLSRVRWLDLGRVSSTGIPWIEFDAEPVTAERVVREYPSGV